MSSLLPSGAALETIERHSPLDDAPNSLVFVSDWQSPFAQRIWLALEERGIPYQYIEASDDQKSLDSSSISPLGQLPIVQINGQSLRGSIALIEYLEEAFPNHQPKLLSNDAFQRATERTWTDYIRRTIIPPFLRVIRSRTENRANILDLFKALGVYIHEVKGPFFSGDAPTLPDIVIAPFISLARISGRSSSLSSDGPEGYLQYEAAIIGLESLKRITPDNVVPPEVPTTSAALSPANLPIEIVTRIIQFTHDYELACGIGLSSAIAVPSEWASQSTPFDRAILSGKLATVQTCVAEGNTDFTTLGAHAAIRLNYLGIINYVHEIAPDRFKALCRCSLPEIASAWGRVTVLEWAHNCAAFGIPENLWPAAIDDASRNGHVDVLDWWRTSGIKLHYSEHALSGATAQSRLEVLDWWRSSGLPLKIGHVMDVASQHGDLQVLNWWRDSGLEPKATKNALTQLSITGNIEILDWWLNSGLTMSFDKDVLLFATKYGKLDILQWWENSGLSILYTAFDVEEAMEDSECPKEIKEAIGKWWEKRGIKFGDTTDWSRPRQMGR